MKNKFLLLIIFIFFFISPFCSSSEEKSDKQTKADACVKLIRSRISQDQSYYTEIIDFLSAGMKKEEALNKLFSLSLLSCYRDIAFFDAEEIDRSPKVNAMTADNKQLLAWEKWEGLFKENNEETLNYEMASLNEAIQDLKSGEVDLSYLNQAPQGQNGYNQQNEYDERMDYITNREKKIDFSIFGFNFTQLDEKSKNLLGISLIILVFVFVLGGPKWISSMRNQNKKDKKKKKKNN